MCKLSMRYTTKQIKTAVNTIAERLDEEVPGWEEKVDRSKLDMKDAVQGCIGAQLGWPEVCKCNPEDMDVTIACCWDSAAYRDSELIGLHWSNVISKRLMKKRVKELVWRIRRSGSR